MIVLFWRQFEGDLATDRGGGSLSSGNKDGNNRKVDAGVQK